MVQAPARILAVVRKVARLDGARSAEAPGAQRSWAAFPRVSTICCSAPPAWTCLIRRHRPRSGRRHAPRYSRRGARHAGGTDGAGGARFTVVAGVGQETVTAVRRRGGHFVYTLTRHGDGTVPTVSAQLPGARSLSTPGSGASDLTRDAAAVAAAVADILHRGRTTRLASQLRGASRAVAATNPDAQLRHAGVAKVDWAALTPRQRRAFLENLDGDPRLALRVPARHRR